MQKEPQKEGSLSFFSRLLRCTHSSRKDRQEMPSVLVLFPTQRFSLRSLRLCERHKLFSCSLSFGIRSPNSVLRVLRALRGEFSLASVPCEPKLEVTTHSKRQGTILSLCGFVEEKRSILTAKAKRIGQCRLYRHFR